MTEEEKQRIIEELKLQQAYAHKFNNPQLKMITGCALKLIQNQDQIIKNQSYTNKKMKKKLDNYRKLTKFKERKIQNQDTEINKLKCKIKNSIYILKHNIKQFEEYSDSELEEWLNNFDKCAIKKGK